MSKREKAAKWLFWIAAIGVVGAIFQYPIAQYPFTWASLIALMTPYLYLQFKRGKTTRDDSIAGDGR